MYVEVVIDFFEEEIDFFFDGKVVGDLDVILESLKKVSVEVK